MYHFNFKLSALQLRQPMLTCFENNEWLTTLIFPCIYYHNTCLQAVCEECVNIDSLKLESVGSVGMNESSLRRCSVRASSGDAPLFAPSNVTRLKITRTNQYLSHCCNPTDDLQHKPMLRGLDNHSALQGQLVSGGIGGWRSNCSCERRLVQILAE